MYHVKRQCNICLFYKDVFTTFRILFLLFISILFLILIQLMPARNLYQFAHHAAEPLQGCKEAAFH